MTYLELVNKVLRRLREEQVGSVSESSYSQLIGDMVNDAKRLVEDAWQWSQLIDWVSYETVAGQYNYSLNNESDALTGVQGAPLRERARFRRNTETGDILSFISYPLGKEGKLKEFAFDKDFDQRAYEISSNTRGTPEFVGLQPLFPFEEGKINKNLVLWPVPDTTGLITTTYFTNPQNDLEDDTEVLMVPHEIVFQFAYHSAIFERGEELGETVDLIGTKAKMALQDAISHDAAMQGYKGLTFVQS
jgi:hypothetical protein